MFPEVRFLVEGSAGALIKALEELKHIGGDVVLGVCGLVLAKASKLV